MLELLLINLILLQLLAQFCYVGLDLFDLTLNTMELCRHGN